MIEYAVQSAKNVFRHTPWALGVLFVANTAPQADDRMEIAAVAVGWAIRSMPAEVQRGLTLEVQIGGVYDRARSEAVARKVEARAVPESEVKRCETEGARRACRLVSTTLFVSVNLPATDPDSVTTVSVSVMRPGPVDSACRGVHTFTEVLEVVRTGAGWQRLRTTEAGEC